MTTGKTIALTRRTFVAKVMSLLLNMRFLPPIIFNPDLFKKVGDIKGTFHARMGMIKDRNGTDLTEAEEIKKRWQEYTELYKKGHNDLDNHDGVVTHLQPDILEVKSNGP